MTDTAWKALERRVSKRLGGQRNPLSGRDSKHTSGDVIHRLFYVEVKQRKRVPFMTDFLDAKMKASKEGKPLLFVFHQKGSLHTVVMADLDDVTAFLDKFKAFIPLLPSSIVSTTSSPKPSCLHEETVATFGSSERFCKKCGVVMPNY